MFCFCWERLRLLSEGVALARVPQPCRGHGRYRMLCCCFFDDGLQRGSVCNILQLRMLSEPFASSCRCCLQHPAIIDRAFAVFLFDLFATAGFRGSYLIKACREICAGEETQVDPHLDVSSRLFRTVCCSRVVGVAWFAFPALCFAANRSDEAHIL